MEKIDYKKKLSRFYAVKKGQITMEDVPAMNYLTITGEGNPNTSNDYKKAVEALYTLSYAIKFKIKKGEMRIDYAVMPLEGQWWTDDMKDFSVYNKDKWKWTMAIMQPEFVTSALVDLCKEEVREKKDPPSLDKIHFENVQDGLSAQILHTGPYAEEAPTIALLHKTIKERGFMLSGKHREIYLNDPRRTAGENLRTIIRQPISEQN